MSITDFSAAALSEAIHSREVSCREVMDAYLDRVDDENPAVNAIVSRRDRDDLMTEARVCDEELAHDLSRGWMHGMPQAIKDLADVRGMPSTFGSRLLEHNVPDRDCLMVARMRAAVSLATRMLPVADGSDYMGSLRNPAAWNNIFGMRPSEGRVPGWPARDTYLSEMGVEGPMGRTVLDVALLLGTQAGYDARVPGSLAGRLDEFGSIARARASLDDDPAGTTIGWLGDLDGRLAMEPGIIDVCVDGLRSLGELGCHVEDAGIDTDLDAVWDAWLVWRHLSVAAMMRPLLKSPSDRDLVKPEVLWELDQGTALAGHHMSAAAEVRTAYHTAMVSLFDRFDVLALPTAQVWPFPAHERWPQHIGDRKMDTYHRWMECTLYATFAGLPAISVPVGFDDRGLPMGMQLIGAPRADADLLRLAAAYETTLARPTGV
jgi:amidase